MKLVGAVSLVVCWISGLAACTAQTAPISSQWAQPAAELAGQIADLLGPGQAQLTVRSLSTIPAGEVPGIRKLLEQDLKTRGVVVGGPESANAIRVTLSENARERLWVAETVEGDRTRIAMVHVAAGEAAAATHGSSERVVLRKEKIGGIAGRPGAGGKDVAVLAAAEINGHFVVMFADRISVYSSAAGGWTESNTFAMNPKMSRDPRGVIVPAADGGSFAAYTAGTQCSGSYSLPLNGGTQESGWTVRCRVSDDPWPVYQSADASSGPALKAFYNTARDFFTGVVTPNIGVDLPVFYAAGMIPRAAGGAAVLLMGVDGKLQIVENGALRTVSGARDWGSDFAAVRSGCGAGTQVIASGSREAVSDTLRAFAIPALEAIPESNTLQMDGTVTALWTAQDGKSAMTVVRNGAGEYEVDRVSATCN
ncbi:hypothetical protein [Occallatibacter savannae]|uniref:hypothetical protein n=1 Tax=Occallatibacter savannae TaxID=1002691 RepID=UPI0013A5A10E|nr:hypothetical protein [Occallatibacter savannae]